MKKYLPQALPQSGDTVIVGMSGGVDSTLTALLLQQCGCRVIGVTMSLWDGHIQELHSAKPVHDACYSPHEKEDIEQCRTFCSEHGIEYHVLDVSQAYNREVLDYFTAEYRRGRTPNPCIRCNSVIKFGALLDSVSRMGIEYDYFCTGHYAMIVRPSEGLWGTDVQPCMIAAALDSSKDQTYFLYRLPSSLLEKVRFPLATLHKSEVFALARQAGLDVADKPESQDFIDGRYFNALFADKPSVPGKVLDTDGNVIGTHRGIEHYTIGQRKGFQTNLDYPVYIKNINAADNTITVARRDENLSEYLIAEDCIWPGNIEPNESFQAIVKIRLRSKPASVTVTRENEMQWRMTFDEPQDAVTPGQSAVLYQDGVIVGGGIITDKG